MAKFCTACGNPVQSEWKVCPYCSHPVFRALKSVEQNFPKQQPREQYESSIAYAGEFKDEKITKRQLTGRQKKGLIIGTIILLVFLFNSSNTFTSLKII